MCFWWLLISKEKTQNITTANNDDDDDDYEKKINDRKAMTTNTITTIKRIIFDGKNENFSEQVKQTERK